MSNFESNFPVDGSSALRAETLSPASTRIISFSESSKHPRHAKLKEPSNADAGHAFFTTISSFLCKGEMISALRYGSCAGKPSGRMSSLQAAAAALAFFVFFLGTLLFI